MRRLVTIIFGVVALPSFIAGQSPSDTTLALVGGRIYSSPNAAPIENGAVVIRNGKIDQVGPRRSITIPAGAVIFDTVRKIVAAGFQNSHVHFTEDNWIGAADQPGP